MAPADENECRLMLSTAFQHPGPAAVRYPRGNGPGAKIEPGLATLPIGKADVRRRGQRIAMLAFGALVPVADAVAQEIDATCVNMRYVKPLDETLLAELARSHDAFVTLEDNAVQGGAGSAVAEWLAAQGIDKPILILGLPDEFIEHASREEILADCGLDAAGVRAALLQRWPELTQARPRAAV
jgi:1-deoxy-D-xylulose-5-phosphate synthase